MNYRKSLFCVIYRKKKSLFSKKTKLFYLILKRKLHWKGWEFPKGGIEPKETIKKAVIREIKEETSQKPFNIKSYKISGKYNYNKKFKDRPNIKGQTYKLFSAELKNKKIKIDNIEHSTYKWLPYKKALKKLTWQNQKKCLRVVDEEIRKR